MSRPVFLRDDAIWANHPDLYSGPFKSVPGHGPNAVHSPRMIGPNILNIPGQRLKVRPGCLLIAEPFLADPYFRRAVVLLADHNDKGSFGLILNKPIPLALSDALDNAPNFDGHLNLGGPVERNTLHFIHRVGDKIPNSALVCEGIYWGGNFDRAKELMSRGELTEADIRLFIGYSGWGAGQLDKEMKEKSWIVAEPKEELVFSPEPEQLWPEALRDLGGPYTVMSTFPEDPRLN